MRVLYLPHDIASRATITSEAMNLLDGIEAKCLFFNENKFSIPNPAAKRILFPSLRKKPLQHTLQKIYGLFVAIRLMMWADVIHYNSNSPFKGIDIFFAKLLNKKGIIEWVGSDIRNPEVLAPINPFYKDALSNGYEYLESAEKSRKTQSRFAKANFLPLVTHEMALFIDKTLFDRFEIIYHRIDHTLFEPKYPNLDCTRPLIVHSPTARVAKGSNYIFEAMEELGDQVEFKLIENMERNDALELMAKADVFIDQIILGTYGLATVEAMATGKAVVVYIMPEIYANGLTADFPVCNVNPSNIKEKIVELVNNANLRNDLGKKSRQAVEEHFDSKKAAQNLIRIYKSL